jgi:hypothetical protein
MLFALIDYFQFARRVGRYGVNQQSNMAIAFDGPPPPEAVDDMLPGDAFVTQRLDDWFSWAMMYFSSSCIDHCGIYVGNGKVFHQTFTVSKEHELDYVAEGTRFLAIRLDTRSFERVDKDKKPEKVSEAAARASKPRLYPRLPARLQLSWVGVKIVLGFYPERFKWKFVADVVILAALVDAGTIWFSGFPFVLAGAAIVALIAAGNQVRWWLWRWQKRPPPEPMSHPDLLLRIFFRSGGLMFTRIGPIVVGDFGLLPLAAAKKLAAPIEGDSDLQLEEFQKGFRELLESLNVLDSGEDSPDASVG